MLIVTSLYIVAGIVLATALVAWLCAYAPEER